MFTLIQSHDFEKNYHLLTEVFKLRKKVFFDQLGWDVPVSGQMEFDEYDTKNAQFLVWCSPDRKKLYGLIRLMPTSGPTLLFDVFSRTHDNSTNLMADDIIEGTRMCINEELVAQDFPILAPGAGFNFLFLALCEVGLALGARRFVSNFEPAMSRIYRRAGLEYDLHGKAHGYGKRPVCCASFEVSMQVLKKMRKVIGIDLPVATLPQHVQALSVTQVQEEPITLSRFG
jgi:acyl homoserine lactone synthase